MKNRRFPYGYEMRNVIIQINEKEATVLIRIFEQYITEVILKKLLIALPLAKLNIYLMSAIGIKVV